MRLLNLNNDFRREQIASIPSQSQRCKTLCLVYFVIESLTGMPN